MNLRSPKHYRGQLAVGLAFAFAGVLAMFGLVFNFALNTREKMKLQTTTDYAALIAANVQKDGLNNIIPINQFIESQWFALEPILNTPWCALTVLPSGTDLSSVSAKISGFLAVNQITVKPTQVEPPDVPLDPMCDALCNAYDKFFRDRAIGLYQALQAEAAGVIVNYYLDQTNKIAFDTALDNFLSPNNLPHGIYVSLEERLGEGLTLENVKKEYEQGTLANEEYAYEILGQYQADPLFIPAQEFRVTYHTDYDYPTNPPLSGIGQPWCGFAAGKIALQNFSVLPVRVGRKAGTYPSHYYTGVRYRPPPSLIERLLKLQIKNPDRSSDDFGSEEDSIDGQLSLFQRRTREMQAVAAAKPYGGLFPKAALPFDKLGLSGSAGEKFDGAKLFGIADSTELEGHRIHRADACIERMDEWGNNLEDVCYTAEDFLH